MESPGACIKRERELRGFSIQDVHEATRIPIKILVDLEADNYEALPQAAFIKGYIKASCKFMGLDETDLVLRYELYMKDNAPVEEPPAEVAPAGPVRAVSLSSKRVVGLLLVLGLLIIIGFYLFSGTDGEEKLVKSTSAPAAPASIEVAESTAPAEMEKAKSLAPVHKTVKAPAIEMRPPGHVLKVIASDDVWVQLTIDNKKPFEILFKKGESRHWLMKKGVDLVIGNAGGMTLVFDGKPVKTVKKPGRVIKMRLPPPG